MAAKKRNDPGLETLLDLDGEIFAMDNGYWTKFEVKRVEPKDEIPHGIKYSLTLHDKNNTRILGYDNAHAVKPKRGKFAAKKIEWDHKHDKDKIKSYEFNTAGKLLKDFWDDVNRIVNGN